MLFTYYLKDYKAKYSSRLTKHFTISSLIYRPLGLETNIHLDENDFLSKGNYTRGINMQFDQ